MKRGIALDLRKFVVPEYVYGLGAISLAGQYAVNYGANKVLVVTDKGVQNAGWTRKAIKSLTHQNLSYQIYNNVSSNPRDSEVMEGAEIYLSSGCNLILAVGGGSPIDCAKGIGIVSTNRKNILNFEGIDKVTKPMPPLICIPTTGGTSADVSQFAIILDTNRKVKIAIISKAVVPDVALIDPATLTTMDNYLTACTGIDAMVHAVEAFVSNASSLSTDMHAVKAIEVIYNNLLLSISEPKNLEYRSNVMFGSLQAGMAFSNASLGVVHAMAHSLGGMLDLPHGHCNALLLNHVMDYNYKFSENKFSKIAELIKLDLRGLTAKQKKKAIYNRIVDFKTSVGITSSLSSSGVKSSDIPILAQNAIKDACAVTNPRVPTLRDLEVIYEEAL